MCYKHGGFGENMKKENSTKEEILQNAIRLFKEKGYDWCPENVLELQDFDATDWEVSSKKYVKNASIGDILLDGEEDVSMIVIDDDGDYLTTIDENGCLETIDLDCNCYEKVGFYALIDNVIDLLKTSREELKK